ncbi:hypothetical protein RJ639_042749 [Escallonia herrerae]|uniref:Cytochrome P450 n=1 Tax=Escallonia herrerae TaxID=1293975 RepID=A0AA88W980_9ASTE|nr:hypothetical protein RJ639_042749 [Escallonia herrerae]
MESLFFSALGFSCLLLILYCMQRTFNSIWWKPKSLEKHLKQQGIGGTSYKFLYGDMKDLKRMMMEAWSKPMALSHQIAPRVNPFYHQMVQNHGKSKDNLSADVIARSAFGSSLEEGKKIFELQKEQVVLVIEASQALYIPGLRFLPTKKNKRRYEIENEIKCMLRNMIQKKEVAVQNGEPFADDLLGLLLQCKRELDDEMTTEDVIEECKLFYFAGQETTANWLTWTIIVLSMHPNWQDKAREEVLKSCGKNKPDLQTINHLKIDNSDILTAEPILGACQSLLMLKYIYRRCCFIMTQDIGVTMYTNSGQKAFLKEFQRHSFHLDGDPDSV